MEQFEKVFARFCPKKTNNLTEAARLIIGYEGEWEAYWVIEREPYKGQWAFMPCDKTICVGWIPEEDLKFIDNDDGYVENITIFDTSLTDSHVKQLYLQGV